MISHRNNQVRGTSETSHKISSIVKFQRLWKSCIVIFSNIFNQKKSYLYVCMYLFSTEKKNLTCNDHCLPVGVHLTGVHQSELEPILQNKYSNPEVNVTDRGITNRHALGQARLSWSSGEVTAWVDTVMSRGSIQTETRCLSSGASAESSKLFLYPKELWRLMGWSGANSNVRSW